MRKIFLIVCILILVSDTGCRTKTYLPEKAIENGEIVSYWNGTFNVDKLDKFIENVNNNISDKIKITKYGDEGMYLIENISYDGKIIKAVFDSTMAFFKSERRKEEKEFNEIQKVEESTEEKNISVLRYYLINQDEKIEIFITAE